MKVRLTVDIPVKKSHGAVEGAEFEAREETQPDKLPGVWCTDIHGEEFKALNREYVVINE